jgi:hypothetical protein
MENGEPWTAAVAGGHETLDGGGDGVVKAPCDGGSWRGDVPMWTQDGRRGGGERRTVGVGVVEAIWGGGRWIRRRATYAVCASERRGKATTLLGHKSDRDNRVTTLVGNESNQPPDARGTTGGGAAWRRMGGGDDLWAAEAAGEVRS